MATIQEVYIALFGRPADPLGYQYYVQATSDGANLDAVGDLSNSPEYLSRFDGQSEIDMINQIYQDLFGRPADADGLMFYAALLQSGEASVQDIAIRILDGATGTDQDVVDNKVAAAQAFTEALDTSEEILAYQGDRAADLGREFLNGVTSDDSTVPSQEEVDAAVQALVDDAENPIGDAVFTLTPAIDEIDGTQFADVFRAITANALDSTDILNGAGGNDVLNIASNGIDIGGAAPVINSIETINNASTEALDLSSVTGIARINSSASSTYNNASVATTFAVHAAGVTSTVNFTAPTLDGDTTVNLATNLSVGGSVAFEFGALATAEKIESITIEVNSPTEALASLVLDSDLDGLEVITVTGNGNVALNSGSVGQAVLSLDASASTGDVSAVTSLATQLTSVSTGSGADEIELAGQEDVTVELGAGNDQLNINGDEQGLNVTLGGGNDVLVLSNVPENIFDADEADFSADIMTIADFNGSQDFIVMGGVSLVVLNNVQQGSIGAGLGDNLFDAVQDAAAFTTAAGQAVVFEFNNNTYVYVADDADGIFEAGDGLVELTGFTGDFTASNFAA